MAKEQTMGFQIPRIWVWLALTLSFSSAYDIIPGRPIDHTKSICSSWGNFHYKTFDGVIYQFPGTCNYNLASHCGDSYHEFSVHIQRAIEDGDPVIHQILIQIKDVTLELKRDAKKVNGEIFESPYFNYGVSITKKDGYTKVHTKIGLTLTWNQEDSVMLEVDSKYQNKMCGLCGDYNGAPVSNEFYLNDMPLNPIQFGNMQNINDPTLTCTNVDESQQMNVSSCGQYYSVCKSYLSQSAFSSCQDLFDISDYVMACMLDVCSCSSADVSCLCSTLTEFSRQCTHAGGIPQNWRTNDLCPKQCPGNMVYKESGSPCISSCSHHEIKSHCEEHDVDGCFCPDGTVWDDYNKAGCISISECHCKYQDQLYAPGSKILNDCEECSCNAGKWTCTHGICPKVCSIEGGAHFKTFDGKSYKFHGNCYYLLTKARHGETHAIVAELTPCNAHSRETCLKTIQFYTDDNKNVLSIRADGSVLLNDLKISIPQVTGSFSVIQPTESNIFVKTKFGLQIQIYLLPLMQLYISMDNSAKNTFEGLCGNFNYIEGDDFKTSAGIEESTASAFANTWKIQSTCQESVEVLIDPCSFSIETKIYAEKWCSKLRDSESPFWKCHFAVDPVEYYKRCEYDTCSCSHSEACMCATLSSYARACAAKGIILWDWRRGICDKEIPSCPGSQTYLYNITTCQSTCRSLALGEKECDSEFTPIDGCGCPDGMYLNEKDGCVPISQCSCYHQGMYLRPNEVFYKLDERCHCHEGKLNCESFINESFLYQMGAGCISGCVCPDGLLDDGNGRCVHESSCPCSYNNEVFPHGYRLIEECKSCTCESGLWSCIQTPCYGTCTIYGSGHYITFDKKFYEFDGSCEFVVAQDYCGDSASNGTFKIITENIPCGTTGVTCSKSIKIYLGNTELKLTNSHMEKKFGESETDVKYRIREVGLYLAIRTSSDISLIWDKKTSLLIRLPSSYKGKVCGLCGNYDDNSNNDFLTSQLIQASNVIPFGNSWKRSNECPDANSIPQPCLAAPHRRSWAEKKCDIITNDVFRSCHSKVDPKPFYDACVNDVCSCDTGGDCECFCTAVAAYAQLCAKADVCIHWRTPEICPIFCDYYNTNENECMWHYFACGPEDRSIHHITKYCHSPSVTHLEGCYPTCPAERPYYDEIQKKCFKHCPCIINNITYSSGEHIPNSDPCLICYKKGKLFTDFNFSFSTCDEHGEKSCSRNSECCIDNFTTGTPSIHPPDTTISIHASKGLCAHRKCVNGKIITTTKLCSIPTTTTAIHRTTTHTTKCTCYYNGTVYTPGQEITRSVVYGKCYKVVCDGNCGEPPATEIPCTTTTTPTTTHTTTNTTTSTTKTTTKSTTVTTISTTTPCVPHTSWQICNCTKAVCNSNGQLQIVQKSCTPPPEITCANKMKPIAVPDDDSCCWHWECPCMCGGWGDHYLTFDGTYYAYQGSCSYVLMEEIVKTVDNFGIYLDNYHCEDKTGITCPRKLTVRHKNQEITISPKTFSPISLETRVNGDLVLLPYTQYGITVYQSGVYVVIEIPELQTNVTYNGLTFSIMMPFGKFYKNTHGQCGTCTNNQADDFLMANGKITTNAVAMADSFMVHNPDKPRCKSIPPVHPKTCKSPLCDLIMGPVFQNCHAFHSPEPFYQACLLDSCNKANSNNECTSLQHYASICGDRGVCIQWRSHASTCPMTCPSDKVYNACGPALPITCQSIPADAMSLKHDRRVMEGCFCAKGSMPFSMATDVCVSSCGCVGPDNVPRKYGESFEYNCETCTCLKGGRGITCQRQQCHHVRNEECTREGFYKVTQISSTNKCCEETVCRCDLSRCSNTFPKCGPGFELKWGIKEGHCCPTYVCEPKHVCVSGNAEYLPGSHVYSEKCESCICEQHKNNFSIACHPIVCNIHCPAGFKVKKNSPTDCCGTCQQTNCVVKYGGSNRLMNPGDVLPSMNDNCTMYKCSLINDQFVTTVSQTSCPSLNEEECEPGSIQLSHNGCCKTCIQKKSSCKLQAVDDYLTYQGCTSVTRVRMSRCEGSCGTFSMYSSEERTMSKKCSCCQEVQTARNKVTLRCPDGTLLDHEYIDVLECKCAGTKCHDGNV
ncbi:mucin-2 [Xenopus tropicalis]|uniref:von Willebrand factor n=1 Tax=Xenopus tropicalis TaxID=8364 RepID=A0A8J1JHX6_XENTR|nr:mucin-2 [Xenopus tropicalis]